MKPTTSIILSALGLLTLLVSCELDTPPAPVYDNPWDPENPFPPRAPSGLSAAALSSTQIRLQWRDMSGNEKGFTLERKTGADGSWAEIDSVRANDTTYLDTGLVLTTYTYRVRAFNIAGSSGYSNDVSVAPFPSSSNLTAARVSSTQINLSWRDNSEIEDGFWIERKTGAGASFAPIAEVGANVTSYSDGGLTKSTLYTYRVYAFAGEFVSDYSNEVIAGTYEFGELVCTLTGHSDYVSSVAFSPDGQYIASGSGDKSIKLWWVSDGSVVRTLTGHSDYVSSVAFSPDGQYIASGSGDKSIKLWRASDGSEVRTLTGHSDYVRSVAFSPDGEYIASGSDDYSIKLWRVSDGSEVRTLTGHSSDVWSVAFSPDGAYLASGSGGWSIKLWRVSDGSEVRNITGHSGGVLSVAFSSDGQYIASGSFQKVNLWRVSDGSEVRTLTGHSDYVSSVAFNPDGQHLASGSGDNSIKLWRVSDWQEIQTLTGHSGSVWSVAFSPNGSLLASGSGDNTIKIWWVK
jgi:WD40 repeat protein